MDKDLQTLNMLQQVPIVGQINQLHLLNYCWLALENTFLLRIVLNVHSRHSSLLIWPPHFPLPPPQWLNPILSSKSFIRSTKTKNGLCFRHALYDL